MLSLKKLFPYLVPPSTSCLPSLCIERTIAGSLKYLSIYFILHSRTVLNINRLSVCTLKMDRPAPQDEPRAEEPEQTVLSNHVKPDTLTRSIWSETSILSRVLKQFEICVQDSKSPNVGKGLFCLEDVKAGELIFKIKQPPMTHVFKSYIRYNSRVMSINTTIDTSYEDLDSCLLLLLFES
jgi:hypothetical protein